MLLGTIIFQKIAKLTNTSLAVVVRIAVRRYRFYSVLVLYFLSAVSLSARGNSGSVKTAPQPVQNPLQIPELLDSRTTPEIELAMQHGAHEFYPGVQSDTKGFSGDYLGPTIRLYRDTEATITFTKRIEGGRTQSSSEMRLPK